MRSSLLRRMILAQGMVLGVVWVIGLGVGTWTLYVSKKGWFDDTLDIVSSALVTMLQDEPSPERIRTQARRIQQLDETFTKTEGLKRGEYRGMYQVLDAGGSMIFRSENAPLVPLTAGKEGFHFVVQDGRSYRVRVRQDPAGRIRVMVAVPYDLMERVMWRGLRDSPLQLLIMFMVLAFFTWLTSRVALRPLKRLAVDVGSRTPWDLAPLKGHPRLRETRPLIDALDRLFHRVGSLLESQRRFIADAAHELRTPLAVVGAQAEVLQREVEDAPREAAGAELQRGVDRAARLVGQLLTLARLETAETLTSGVSLDLAHLAEERLSLALPHAIAKGQDLGYEGPPSLMISGSPAMLVHVFDNLLSNAIRHTPAGGRITCHLYRHAGDAVVVLEDSGPGLPEALRERVFERFGQHVERDGNGAGLGLAIVKQAVERHGGSVALTTSGVAGGLRATIRLPQTEKGR